MDAEQSHRSGFAVRGSGWRDGALGNICEIGSELDGGMKQTIMSISLVRGRDRYKEGAAGWRHDIALAAWLT
jgi:hypothetical protein